MPEISLQKIQQLVDDKNKSAGALLPILHAIQHQFGYIPPQALPMIAKALQQSEAEIYGVISFYSHFYLEPRGKHIVEICRGEACQAMGSVPLEQAAKTQLAIDYQQTTKDKNITLAPVYCLGNCACAPSVKVGDKVFGRMNAEKFEQLTDQLSSYKINLSKEY
jgi:formate dehydrogenase subunit gamma